MPVMALSPFLITELVIDCQHIREYPRATWAGNDVLKLAVKRYTPRSNPNPQPGDVTIIRAHGSGFPKVGHSPQIGVTGCLSYKRDREKKHIFLIYFNNRNFTSRSGKRCFSD
jgi:hypothetical protein